MERETRGEPAERIQPGQPGIQGRCGGKQWRWQGRARLVAAGALAVAGLAGAAGPAAATTKGLNQIVTPDIQPTGLFSVSAQWEDAALGNPVQAQFELGITRRFEAAVFQGFSPGAQVLNVEYALRDKLPYLLSIGSANMTTRGTSAQPFLEAGYYKGAHRLIAGVIRANRETQAILGWGYQARPRLALQLDYQSGTGNSSTAGFTYNITPMLSLNPAVYLTNDSPHRLHGYAVLTWNVQLWKGA
jgi:hypothetical protein